jgi:hypothetical protein
VNGGRQRWDGIRGSGGGCVPGEDQGVEHDRPARDDEEPDPEEHEHHPAHLAADRVPALHDSIEK